MEIEKFPAMTFFSCDISLNSINIMPIYTSDRFSKIHAFEGVANTFFVGLLYLNQVKCGILFVVYCYWLKTDWNFYFYLDVKDFYKSKESDWKTFRKCVRVIMNSLCENKINLRVFFGVNRGTNRVTVTEDTIEIVGSVFVL